MHLSLSILFASQMELNWNCPQFVLWLHLPALCCSSDLSRHASALENHPHLGGKRLLMLYDHAAPPLSPAFIHTSKELMQAFMKPERSQL